MLRPEISRRIVLSCVAVGLSAASHFSSYAFAQAYPGKPVRIVAPFAPGGTADTLGRIVAAKLSEAYSQSFIVENRAGAGGIVGSDIVAKSAPDGYMLVVSGIASHAIGPAMMAKPPFDPLKDFSHIALFGGPPLVFAVDPSLPSKDLKGFVNLAKAKAGSFNYGSPGNGTHGHLFAELLKQIHGISMQHIPYKGASGAVADLMAGRLAGLSTTLTTASSSVKSGKARALAISAEARLPDYPDVPTFKELGYPELTAVTWFSLSGPAGTPGEIVSRLNADVRRVLQLPDVRQRLRPEGIEPGTLDPKEFADFVAAEYKRWSAVVRSSGAKRD